MDNAIGDYLIRRIQKSGAGGSVNLPVDYARALKLEPGDHVRVEMSPGVIHISKEGVGVVKAGGRGDE